MGKSVIHSNDVVWEEINGQVLVVQPSSGARWLLNSAAAAIWKICDRACGAADFASLQTRAEVAEFIAAFERMGLLQAGGASTPVLAGVQMNFEGFPEFQQLSAGGGGRRRPRPGGVSGPV